MSETAIKARTSRSNGKESNGKYIYMQKEQDRTDTM